MAPSSPALPRSSPSARPTAASVSTCAAAPCSAAVAASCRSRSRRVSRSCRRAAGWCSIGWPASGCFQVCASACPAAALSAPAPPELHTLGERERRAWLMLTVQLYCLAEAWRLWQAGAWRQELRQLLELLAARADHRLHPLSWPLPVPLRVHGHYSRTEIEAAFGVLWHKPSRCDLLFVTLRKSEALFSPTTSTRVLALGPSCSTGRIRAPLPPPPPPGSGMSITRRPGGVTEPFVCLGFATYESHEGERIWFVTEWRSAGGCSARSRRRGCQAVAWPCSGVGGLRGRQCRAVSVRLVKKKNRVARPWPM